MENSSKPLFGEALRLHFFDFIAETNMRPTLCIDARHCTSGIKRGNENIVKFRGSNGQLFSLDDAEASFNTLQDSNLEHKMIVDSEDDNNNILFNANSYESPLLKGTIGTM